MVTINAILVFTFLGLASWAQATSFMRVSVDSQLDEADGIFIGHFLEQKSIVVEDGSIATQMSFRLSKEYGLDSQLFGLEEIFVHYPGGTWEGETVIIEGVPQFNVGERVAILAKNIDNRLWGLNLALGSYRIINYGKETRLVNGVFPNDPAVSQIKISDFEHKVKQIKGLNLKVVRSFQHEKARSTQGKNRSIASIESSEENDVEESSRSKTFWPLVFLAVVGAIGSYRVKNRR